MCIRYPHTTAAVVSDLHFSFIPGPCGFIFRPLHSGLYLSPTVAYRGGLIRSGSTNHSAAWRDVTSSIKTHQAAWLALSPARRCRLKHLSRHRYRHFCCLFSVYKLKWHDTGGQGVGGSIKGPWAPGWGQQLGRRHLLNPPETRTGTRPML